MQVDSTHDDIRMQYVWPSGFGYYVTMINAITRQFLPSSYVLFFGFCQIQWIWWLTCGYMSQANSMRSIRMPSCQLKMKVLAGPLIDYHISISACQTCPAIRQEEVMMAAGWTW